MKTVSPAIGAVDIGGTKIAVALEYESGEIASRYEIPTGTEFDEAMQRIVGLLSKGLEETGSQLAGIGIGCSGPVDPFTGVMGNNNFFPHWQGCNPVLTLSKIFGTRVRLENDGDAAALGEGRKGIGVGKERLICVTVGTGIGIGILVDGRVYRGVGGVHPEPGHHIVEPSGPVCTCGARGCWEILASGSAISAWFKENAPQSHNLPDVTTEEICAGARQGDDMCLRAINRGAFYLGIGIANLITIFAPDVIVLGGSVMKSADLFLDTIRNVIHENCRLVPPSHTMVGLASLGTDVGLIGAAEVWRYRIEQEGE